MVERVLTSRLDAIDYERSNHVNRRRRNRPESGRQASNSFAPGTTFADSSVTFSPDAATLFGTDVVFDLGEEGVIFETGGAANGALVAVYDDVLIVRAGVVATPTNDGTARITFPVARIRRGTRNRLAWYFEPSATVGLKVVAWIDGKVIGSSQSVNPNSVWTDAGAGGFMSAIQAPVAVEPTENLQTYSAAVPLELRAYLGSIAPVGGV